MSAHISSPATSSTQSDRTRAVPVISADWLATLAALGLAALAWSGLLPAVGW